MSTQRDRANLARFGITATKAFGVSMANIQVLAKRLGRNHELAAALWDTGWYEARLLTAFVDDPTRVTAAQMDRWCRAFDNWGICDTLCFKLFEPSAACMGQSHAVERQAGGVRQARGLCPARQPLHSRQDDRRRPVLDGLILIERRHRRTKLRQEGGELGLARRRGQDGAGQIASLSINDRRTIRTVPSRGQVANIEKRTGKSLDALAKAERAWW